MAQQLLQDATNTFIKGLITEAGPLTFPKDASVDELNCDLLKDGSRRRRLALSYESGNTLSTETSVSSSVSIGLWKNVGEEAGVEFAVCQIGTDLIFYQFSSSALSSMRVDTTKTSGTEYSLDLSPYETTTGSGVSSSAVEVTSINGGLIVTSPNMNTILIERDSSTGAFTITQINVRVRDFTWQSSTTAYSTNLATGSMTDDRQYDTLNSGWHGEKGTAAITTFETSKTEWPAINLSWFAGKNSSGDFSVAEWDRIEGGTTLRVNGHYILDLFSKDRQTESSADRTLLGGTAISSSLTTTTEDSRFSTAAAYSGRVFYTGLENSTGKNSSKIFFSTTLENGFDGIGDCFQQNDPTSEDLSDLLDTDGGSLTIPEAYNIKKLHVFGARLYVFAENGVWTISGVDDVFRATEYSVSKLTSIGLAEKSSFVNAQGRPYWWSNLGIHTLIATEQGGIIEQNISLQTVQSFWEDITPAAQTEVTSIYDGINKKVIWFYPDTGETVANKVSKALIFDETLSAFYPWTVGNSSDSSRIVGVTFYEGAGSADVDFTVTDSSGAEVQDASGDTVIVTLPGREYSSSAIKLLVVDGTTDKYTFAEFTGTDFLDWGEQNYSSFAEGAYNFLGDMTIKKNVPYVTNYFGVTETGWTGDETIGYIPIRESSCLVSHFWDFKNTAASASQQAYRLKSLPVVNPSNLTVFGYSDTVVTTRLKLRGRGRSVKIRYESEQGKDFHLLGYEYIGARNDRF